MKPDKFSRLNFPTSSKTNLISALSLPETALQLIWSLILHYQIGGAGGGAKKMLLQWVNELLPDVKVVNLQVLVRNQLQHGVGPGGVGLCGEFANALVCSTVWACSGAKLCRFN